MLPAALALIALFGGGVAFLLLRAQARAQVKPSFVLPRGTKVWVAPGAPVPLVYDAVEKAVELLSRVWPRAAVDSMFATAELVVHGTNSWVVAGREVGGSSFGSHLEVDRSMGSLVHEASHALRLLVDHQADEGHEDFEARGIGAIDREYRAWLRLNPATK